jgi:hypothetical protein
MNMAAAAAAAAGRSATAVWTLSKTVTNEQVQLLSLLGL